MYEVVAIGPWKGRQGSKDIVHRPPGRGQGPVRTVFRRRGLPRRAEDRRVRLHTGEGRVETHRDAWATRSGFRQKKIRMISMGCRLARSRTRKHILRRRSRC